MIADAARVLSGAAACRKEIAVTLNMSSGQVNSVIAAICRNLDVHGKAGLMKLVQHIK